MPPAATTPEGVPPAPIDPSTLDPATVTTMVEVRIGIDDLDRRIVTLLGLYLPLLSTPLQPTDNASLQAIECDTSKPRHG